MSMIGASLKDKNGKLSTTRFCTYSTMIVLLSTYLMHNIVSMLNGGSYVDFPANSVVIFGLILGGKVTQSFAEK